MSKSMAKKNTGQRAPVVFYCSAFRLRGECGRGSSCTLIHEMASFTDEGSTKGMLSKLREKKTTSSSVKDSDIERLSDILNGINAPKPEEWSEGEDDAEYEEDLQYQEQCQYYMEEDEENTGPGANKFYDGPNLEELNERKNECLSCECCNGFIYNCKCVKDNENCECWDMWLVENDILEQKNKKSK